MRVTVLIENDSLEGRSDLTGEFGLSLLVEHGARRILFDTGSTELFADNAETLGIELAAVDTAIISHHHFDHAGGLGRFFEVNSQAKAHWVAAEPSRRFARIMHLLKRDIGVDRSMVSRNASRFVEFEQEHDLGDGVFLLADIGRTYPRPSGNKWLFVERDGRLVPDPFDHELTMVIHEQDGMVVFTGCAHTGVLNMVDRAKKRFPETPVKAVIGGFHLMGMPPTKRSMAEDRNDVERLGKRLKELCKGPIHTGHCTGERAYGILKAVLGERLQPLRTGAVIEI